MDVATNQAAIMQRMKHTADIFSSNRTKSPFIEVSQIRQLKYQRRLHDEFPKPKLAFAKSKQHSILIEDQQPTGEENRLALAKGGAGLDTSVSASPSIVSTENLSTGSLDRYGKLAEARDAARVNSRALVARRQPKKVPVPNWHAPWKMMRVISGHTGWVRAIAVDPTNEWFATGAADRSIKLWDLASGTLKLTLTGHIHTVRGLAISSRHPYMFSCGEDKTVRCWDLEYNKVIRNYHGHLSGVYCLTLHPTLDILMSGGRDSVCRVWDMRTKQQIHCLGGHDNTVCAVASQVNDPQVVTGSMDNTIKLWDLAAGKALTTLTHHKKSVRALALHPREFTFASGAADCIKKWAFPRGDFLQNFNGQNTIINAMALNDDGVLVSGGDDGSLRMWDYATGYGFQNTETIVQPGSLDSEAAIFALAFDKTGTRLISGEADKTIKIWRENPESTPDSDPIDMERWTKEVRTIKRF